MWVVNQSKLVHTLLMGHPMLGTLLTTLNGISVMAHHRRLLPMPMIPTGATQVLVRIM